MLGDTPASLTTSSDGRWRWHTGHHAPGTMHHTCHPVCTMAPQAPAPPAGGPLQAAGEEGGGGEGGGDQVWLL